MTLVNFGTLCKRFCHGRSGARTGKSSTSFVAIWNLDNSLDFGVAKVFEGSIEPRESGDLHFAG